MSLVALKRKTQATKNQSTGQSQFSINGTMRNQGYIGQSLESRSLIRTLHKGAVAKGSGGCCGTYNDSPDIEPSELCCLDDSTVVKPSVLSTKGMLANRNRWALRPAPHSVVKPDSNHGVGGGMNSQGVYLERLRRKNTKAIEENCPKPDPEDTVPKPNYCVGIKNAKGQPLFSQSKILCRNLVTKKVGPDTQDLYVSKLNQACTDDDIMYVANTNILRVPFVKLA